MKLSPPQQLVANDKHRFRVIISGRRFGKTHLAISELCKFSTIPDRQCWFVAPTYRQAKQIVWKPLKQRLTHLNWVTSTNETELTIILKNDSVISLKGSDKPDSLRGVGLDFVVLDEFADIDPAAWFEVLRPTLSDKNGHAMFVGTPKGKNNWSYDLFQRQHQYNTWRSFQFTTMDGGRVSAEEIEQAMQDLDERTFRQEYLATFETYVGLVCYAFGDHNILKSEPVTETEPILVGMDFNVNPMSAVIARRMQNGLEIVDEIEIPSSNTDEIVEEIRARYVKNPITIFPDPAGVQRRTSAGGRTDVKILENAGFMVKYHRQHPLIRDRVNSANSLFKNREQLQFRIDPKCKKTIRALQSLCYKEGTQIVDKDSGYDHLFDALTYMIQYLFPIRNNPIKEIPQRWGTKII